MVHSISAMIYSSSRCWHYILHGPLLHHHCQYVMFSLATLQAHKQFSGQLGELTLLYYSRLRLIPLMNNSTARLLINRHIFASHGPPEAAHNSLAIIKLFAHPFFSHNTLLEWIPCQPPPQRNNSYWSHTEGNIVVLKNCIFSDSGMIIFIYLPQWTLWNIVVLKNCIFSDPWIIFFIYLPRWTFFIVLKMP